MNILQKHVYKCRYCGNIRGVVEEEYNGNVPVLCPCGLQEVDGWPSPCMVCPDGERFYWKPISNFKNEKGESWHVPWFEGMRLPSFRVKNEKKQKEKND